MEKIKKTKEALKKCLMFWEIELSSLKLKKLLIFQERTCKAWISWKSKFSYISFHIFWERFSNISAKEKSFPCKEAKFCNIKYFLIVTRRHFFSFYNFFFLYLAIFCFLSSQDFCNFHDHVNAFFRKIFISFTSFFFVVSFYFLGNI